MPRARAALQQPSYWADARAHLMKRDRVLRKLLPQYEQGMLESRGDAFVTLARSIVGQQISVRAAQAVWDRCEAAVPRVTPKHMLAVAPTTLREAGLSQ
ncbi:MAG: DNA-3-methyladenine glycosylase 2 family protein, partial [Burkholderiaceae bacterium]